MGQGLGRNKRQPRDWAVALMGGVASAIGLGLLLTTSADAAQLQSWRFNTAQNRLEFATDDAVQPRVQLIPNPVRLIVDLPGVKIGRPTVNQNYSATVRSIRVGQFDAQTARIVVELSPGYTLDPQQVKVRGASPSSWSVDLPNPQQDQASTDLSAANSSTSLAVDSPSPTAPIVTRPAPRPALPIRPASGVSAVPAGSNLLEDILVTADGLFLRTRKSVTAVQVNRNNAEELVVDVSGATASPNLLQNDYRMDYHGIQLISVRQLSTAPPVTRVTLKVNRRSPDWLASTNRYGGVILLPQGGAAKVPNGKRPTGTVSLSLGQTVGKATIQSPSPFARGQQTATIQSIALGGSQLLVQANQPVYYTTGWEGSRYRVMVRGAQWAQGIRTPQISTGSPLSDLSVRQEGQNVSILATPALGVRISTISRIDAQTLVLNFSRDGSPGAPVFQGTPTAGTVYQQPTLPRSNGRRVVVIDPGHGGTDPGAIGIGGLRETNIVLPISLEVVRLLQQQGLQVYLTRSDESREVDLPPRVALAERVNADVFVSIHANSINLSRQDINGTETYYAPGSVAGAQLGKTILNSILRSVNISSRGMHPARFYVIRKTSMPSTLIETGFVTGAEDAPKLGDPNFQKQMAAAIAQGIIEYLNTR
jgi:N-acetylmuramoyl-L-alanine amidase